MKKKIWAVMACLAIIISTVGCSNEGKVITQTPEGEKIDTRTGRQEDEKQNNDNKQSGKKQTQTPTPTPAPAYADVYSEKQLFAVECLDTYPTRWDDKDGLYIYTESDRSIPYLLIYRYKDMPIDAKQLMEESIEPFIEEDYADQDVSVNPVVREKIAGKDLISISYSYNVDGYRVTAHRSLMQYNDDIINFMVKYYDEDQCEALDEVLDKAVSTFKTFTKKEMSKITAKDDNGDGLKIARSEASQVVYTSYTDYRNYFTMDIPEGWEVIIGIKPSREFDVISYGIELRDPEVPERMLYFNLSTSGLVKSTEAHDWYVKYYGADYPMSKAPIVTDLTTKGFFEGAAKWYGYSDLNVVEDMDNVVVFEAQSENGQKVECLATATVTGINYYVNSNMYSIFSPQIDAGWLTVYDIIMEAAPADEFYDWQPVLDHCLGSIKFSDKYMKDREDAWRTIMGTSATIMSTADEISGMIMDSWEKSSHTYDVTSQKYSDATLGYERVYDTETGDYLKAEIGFTDWYKGERYVPVNSDAAYTAPIAGTIYKAD